MALTNTQDYLRVLQGHNHFFWPRVAKAQHGHVESTDGAGGQRCSQSGPGAPGGEGQQPLDLMAIPDTQFTAGSKLFLLGKLQSGTVSIGSKKPKYSGLFCSPNV